MKKASEQEFPVQTPLPFTIDIILHGIEFVKPFFKKTLKICRNFVKLQREPAASRRTTHFEGRKNAKNHAFTDSALSDANRRPLHSA